MVMKKKIILSLVMVYSLCIVEAERVPRYGQKCSYSCSRSGYSSFNTMKCKDTDTASICQCDFIHTVLYDSETNPECVLHLNYGIGCSQCQDLNSTEVCVDHKCACPEGTLPVGVGFYNKNVNCVKTEYSKPYDQCKMGDPMKACDYRNNSFCQSGKCACFDTHYLNFTTKECVDKKIFTDMYKTSSYKARPLDYCLTSSDCIDGLDCSTSLFKCRCPSGCHYEEEKERCSCGKVEFATPVTVLWTGIILSILSIIVWSCCIRKTMQKGRKKHSGNLDIVMLSNTTTTDNEPLNAPLNQPSNEPLKPFNDPPPPYSATPLTTFGDYASDNAGKKSPPPDYSSNFTTPVKAAPSLSPFQATTQSSSIPYPLSPTSNSQETPSVPYPKNPSPSLPLLYPTDSVASGGLPSSYPLSPVGGEVASNFGGSSGQNDIPYPVAPTKNDSTDSKDEFGITNSGYDTSAPFTFQPMQSNFFSASPSAPPSAPSNLNSGVEKPEDQNVAPVGFGFSTGATPSYKVIGQPD